MNLLRKYPVAVFITLTLLAQFAVVLVSWMLIPEGQDMHADSPGARAAHMVFRLRVFFPLGLAILLTFLLDGAAGVRKLFASFFHWRVPFKWYAMAFSWKFILGYIGIFSVVLMGLHPWQGWINPTWLGNLIHTGLFVVGIAVVEETSWIRFSVTRLQEKRSAFFSSTVVGLAWGAWYLMMMLIGEGVPDGIPWFAFIISMFSLTVLLTWAYNTTRSGTVLLIMQIFSNCAFLVTPILPGPGAEPYAMNGFVVAFLVLAIVLLRAAGTENLRVGGERARWSDPAK